jgi:hypothetical protein
LVHIAIFLVFLSSSAIFSLLGSNLVKKEAN